MRKTFEIKLFSGTEELFVGGKSIMKKTLKKSMTVTMAAAMMMSLAACGNTQQDTAATPASSEAADTQAASTEQASSEAASTEAVSADLSGTIALAGSTSMEKLANAVAESFMEKYPNVTVTAEFTGSSAGIESLLAGSADIGDASRALKDSEKEAVK